MNVSELLKKAEANRKEEQIMTVDLYPADFIQSMKSRNFEIATDIIESNKNEHVRNSTEVRHNYTDIVVSSVYDMSLKVRISSSYSQFFINTNNSEVEERKEGIEKSKTLRKLLNNLNTIFNGIEQRRIRQEEEKEAKYASRMEELQETVKELFEAYEAQLSTAPIALSEEANAIEGTYYSDGMAYVQLETGTYTTEASILNAMHVEFNPLETEELVIVLQDGTRKGINQLDSTIKNHVDKVNLLKSYL